MSYDIEHIANSMDKLESSVSNAVNHLQGENSMNDIAGLLALMQGNKNMDLPGLLALCREKGYDRGFMNDGSFLFVFLLFFLMGNGGWGNWGNRDAAAALVGNGQIETITSLFDRISAAQAESANGFNRLQTWLCESIANVTNSVRNQGDRIYDATRNVQDAVKDCCCKLSSELATIECEIKGLGRDIRDGVAMVSSKIDLAQERTRNDMQSMECRLKGEIVENRRITELGFERQACMIRDLAKEQELERLRRENDDLKDRPRGDFIADRAVRRLEEFATNHYTPTRTATTATTL